MEMTTTHNLRNILSFFVLFLNKLYEAIIKENYNKAWVYQNSWLQVPWATILFYIE